MRLQSVAKDRIEFREPTLLYFTFPLLSGSVITPRFILIFALVVTATGCGTTQKRSGTEQLLLSDAVDRSIDQIDVAGLEGHTIFLDATYINPDRSPRPGGVDNYVNSSYIISALRQKLITSGCHLKATADEADYIVEARVGALGTDAVEVTYGLPASNALSSVASLVGSIPVPAIPEISVGKRNAALSTSKVVLFAYHRETGQPVWQSGVALARSDAKDSWILGAGPIQRGSIYDGTQFAGSRLRFPWQSREKVPEAKRLKIADTHQFVVPEVLEQQLAIRAAEVAAEKAGEQSPEIIPAAHEEPAAE